MKKKSFYQENNDKKWFKFLIVLLLSILACIYTNGWQPRDQRAECLNLGLAEEE